MTHLVDDQLLGRVLSAPFASLPEDARTRALERVLALPASIGLLSLRDLAPVIGRLRARHDLNILGMEALAAEGRTATVIS